MLAALAALGLAPSPFPDTLQYNAAVAAASTNESSANTAHSPSGVPTPPVGAEEAARDEMLLDATGQRQHWPSIPRLVVLTSVMTYHVAGSSEYVATSEQLSVNDARGLADDMTAALSLLTAGAFEQFAAVGYESVPADSSVTIARPNQIVVGRFEGVRRLTSTIGFGGRKARDGAIVAAAIVLDSEFDRASAMRRLLRIHELGHAIGLNHVTSRGSIMNPSIGSEMTDQDRRISMLAFRRPDAGRSE